ncbi:MAG TPA: alpha/beta hydrolase [Pseudomonadota bacterium]|nr:alpha/beta hydrolase [Pseudomonadota bacterium]
MTRGLLTLLLSVLLSACAADFQDGDEHFYVVHKGAAMPVWVTGNWRSDRIVLHVHGGPGSTNGIYFQKDSYRRIADQVGIAFYEQRGSGSALGAHRQDLTVDQFVEDARVVMTVLRARYPTARFALMGHSWGGFLGSAILLDPDLQAQFRGWIEMDGAHDASCKSWNYGRDRVLEKGVAGAEAFYRDVWKCDPVTNENNQLDEYGGKRIHLWHSEFVRAAGGYDVKPERVLTGDEIAENLFRSQYDLYAVTQHSPLPVQNFYGRDLTPRLGEIKIPAMVLWGTHDLITPAVNAEPAYRALGAAAPDKELVLFDDSGHNPWAEEQDKFVAAVSRFLSKVLPN